MSEGGCLRRCATLLTDTEEALKAINRGVDLRLRMGHDGLRTPGDDACLFAGHRFEDVRKREERMLIGAESFKGWRSRIGIEVGGRLHRMLDLRRSTIALGGVRVDCVDESRRILGSESQRTESPFFHQVFEQAGVIHRGVADTFQRPRRNQDHWNPNAQLSEIVFFLMEVGSLGVWRKLVIIESTMLI